MDTKELTNLRLKLISKWRKDSKQRSRRGSNYSSDNSDEEDAESVEHMSTEEMKDQAGTILCYYFWFIFLI